LAQDSLVSCLFLATISEDRIERVIGNLSASLMHRLNDCLKAALDIP
jgi:mRNA-degrading endonuclease toxin of MazEF toxin-antitoxin module